MYRHTALFLIFAMTLMALVPEARAESGEPDLRQQVEAVERAFAKTMADREHEAFTTFLSEEAVFISGPLVLRGKQAVSEAWLMYFAGPEAPFSWEPTTVEVLASGSLALSSGPVRDSLGTLVATYTSIWRQEEPGVWRIVLDQGNKACPPSAPRDNPVATE